MPSGVTFAEAGLIHAYQSVADDPDRANIIRQYAGINHFSLGRAEDELELWVHMLAQQRSELHFADSRMRSGSQYRGEASRFGG